MNQTLAMVFSALASAVLASTFFYVWKCLVRRAHVLLWALAWSVAVPYLVFYIRAGMPGASRLDLPLSQVLLVLNGTLMVTGCWHFVRRRPPPRWLGAGLAVALAAAAAFPHAVGVPASVLLGVRHLWAARLFYRLNREQGLRGSRLVATLLALAGLHELDFPLLGPDPRFATAGYLLASTLAIGIAVALLVTILEESRQEVERERAQLRAVVDNLPAGVVVTGTGGEVLLANGAAKDLLGVDLGKQPPGAAGSSPAELEAALFATAAPADGYPIAHVLQSASAWPAREMALRHPDGEDRDALVTAAPVKDPRGRLLGAVAVFNDVRELKRMQAMVAQSERLQGLGTLAAGVAHDFNNALTLILGHTEMGLAAGPSPTVRRAIETIARVAKDSAAAVRRIQDLARTRARRNEQVFDLAELVRDVIQDSRPRWRDEAQVAGLRYEVRTSLEEGILVRGEPGEIREALLNLVLNALDAMPSGGRLSLDLRSEARAGGERAHLAVTDTGTGIPDSVIGRIFDPFFTTKGKRGNGLGLSIVFGIVRRHDGQISVRSRPGEGASFLVDLPRERRADTTTVAPEAPPASQERRRLRLVAVDDEPSVLALTCALLEASGHETHGAEGGRKALELIAALRFDAVLTDLGMPEMNGWQLAARIREVDPDLPVVLVTGWGDTVSAEQARAGGVATVLPKPFSLQQLLAAVDLATRSRAAVGPNGTGEPPRVHRDPEPPPAGPGRQASPLATPRAPGPDAHAADAAEVQSVVCEPSAVDG